MPRIDTDAAREYDDEGQRPEALLVTAPSPTDADHDPVHRGLRNDEFEPTLEGANGADSAGESGGDR